MIKLNINNTKITASDLEPLVEGNVQSIFVEFVFSDEWDELSRTAVFKNGQTKVAVSLTDDECAIPWEVLKAPNKVYVSVRGSGSNGSVVICTANADLGVVEYSDASTTAASAAAATPDVLDTLLADVEALRDDLDELEDDVEALDISGKQDKSTLETDVAAKGFTKNTGTYSKPADGIPKTDLASAVQTLLDKEEVFTATYGTTTYAEISAEITAGKKVQVERITASARYVYDLSYADDTVIRFGQITNSRFYVAHVTSANVWGNSSELYYTKTTADTALAAKQDAATTETVTIAVSDWSGGTTCTKSVTGVTASNIVICAMCSDASVHCIAQGAGTLTFSADATPSADVTVKVIILS